MSVSLQLLAEMMESPEGAHLEFKEARNAFEFDNLVKYCARVRTKAAGEWRSMASCVRKYWRLDPFEGG